MQEQAGTRSGSTEEEKSSVSFWMRGYARHSYSRLKKSASLKLYNFTTFWPTLQKFINTYK